METSKSDGSRWKELIAAGVLRPPAEAGDPCEDWPDIRLPAGTAAELIDADRGEACAARRPKGDASRSDRRRVR